MEGRGPFEFQFRNNIIYRYMLGGRPGDNAMKKINKRDNKKCAAQGYFRPSP